MPVSIRPVRPDDADRVAELTAQLGYELSPAAASERLGHILARPDHVFWVADLDGRVVGWVHAMLARYIDADPYVLIGGLVVDRSHRGQGVGRTLMAQAEAWAAKQGCSLVRLSSSTARTEAHRFYEGLGYTTVKTQRAFAKALDPRAGILLQALVPRVEE